MGVGRMGRLHGSILLLGDILLLADVVVAAAVVEVTPVLLRSIFARSQLIAKGIAIGTVELVLEGSEWVNESALEEPVLAGR